MSHVAGSDRLRVYVQPAVNCQPSYCWGISEIKFQEAKNQILKSGVRRVCLSGPLPWRKSMECNASLQVASYDKYPRPFLTASDSTRHRQSKSRLNIHLFQKCSKQPGSLSLGAGISLQLEHLYRACFPRYYSPYRACSTSHVRVLRMGRCIFSTAVNC